MILPVIGGGGSDTWRLLGTVDFASMTATTITSSPTTVDGVTFVAETTSPFDGVSASDALAVGGTGLRSSGVGSGRRAVSIDMTDFCSAAPSVDYSMAFVVEYTGAPSGAGELVCAVRHDVDNFSAVAANATTVVAVLRDAGVYMTNRSAVHSGSLRRAGAILPPGHMAHIVRLTGSATGVPLHPEEWGSYTQVPLQADPGDPARDSADQLFLYINNDSQSIERVHVFTTEPG